jgi:Rrf2 family protein
VLLTQSTVSSLMLLSWLAMNDQAPRPCGLGHAAEALGLSPTYLAKMAVMLTRAGLLRSWRGAHGGVELAKAPESMTLREIVEACQGPLAEDFCGGGIDAMAASKAGGRVLAVHVPAPCVFRQAMAEAHAALTGALERWTLADLARRCPGAESGAPPLDKSCRLRALCGAQPAAKAPARKSRSIPARS